GHSIVGAVVVRSTDGVGWIEEENGARLQKLLRTGADTIPFNWIEGRVNKEVLRTPRRRGIVIGIDYKVAGRQTSRVWFATTVLRLCTCVRSDAHESEHPEA